MGLQLLFTYLKTQKKKEKHWHFLRPIVNAVLDSEKNIVSKTVIWMQFLKIKLKIYQTVYYHYVC